MLAFVCMYSYLYVLCKSIEEVHQTFMKVLASYWSFLHTVQRTSQMLYHIFCVVSLACLVHVSVMIHYLLRQIDFS